MNAIRLPSAAVVRPLHLSPRALVVEDDRRTRELLASYMRDLGYEVFSAGCGFEALRIVADERPGCIVVDGLLPKMHGFELARLVRAIDARYQPRIVMLTAIYKNVRYRNDAKLKYGIDAYLVKPVTKEILAEVLA